MTQDEIIAKYGKAVQQKDDPSSMSQDEIIAKYGKPVKSADTQSPLYQKPTAGMQMDDINQEAAEIPSNQQMQQQHPLGYKAAQYVSESPALSKAVKSIQPALDFSKKYIVNPVEEAGIPAFAGGRLQNIYDIGRSVANIPSDIASTVSGKQVPEIPSIDLSQDVPQDSVNKAAFFLGQLTGGVGTYQRAMKAAENIPETAAKFAPKFMEEGGKSVDFIKSLGDSALLSSRSLPAMIGRGALYGEATGASNPGGRTASGLAGGLLAPLQGISSKSIANAQAKIYTPLKALYKKGFNEVFKEADSQGISPALSKVFVPVTDDEVASLKSVKGSSGVIKRIQDARDNPTFENVHWAQSDLGKLVASKGPSSKYLSMENEGIHTASSMQRKLLDSLNSHMDELGQPGLSEKYQSLRAGYAQDVLPYESVGTGNYAKNPTRAKASQVVANIKKQKGDIVKDIPSYAEKVSKAQPYLSRDALMNTVMSQAIKKGAMVGLPIGAVYLASKLIGTEGIGRDINNVINQGQ